MIRSNREAAPNEALYGDESCKEALTLRAIAGEGFGFSPGLLNLMLSLSKNQRGFDGGDEARDFRGFLEAAPEGADTSLVMGRFLFWALSGSEHGVLQAPHGDTASLVMSVEGAYQLGEKIRQVRATQAGKLRVLLRESPKTKKEENTDEQGQG